MESLWNMWTDINLIFLVLCILLHETTLEQDDFKSAQCRKVVPVWLRTYTLTVSPTASLNI